MTEEEEKILIYEDEEKKIELSKNFYKLLKNISVESFEISDSEFDILLDITIKTISDLKIKINNATCACNIPLLKSGLHTCFSEPWDIFNDTIYHLENFLTLDTELDEDRIKIMDEVNQDNKIFCYIFPKRIFDVKGFLIYKADEDENRADTIMFFGFKEINPFLIDFLS